MSDQGASMLADVMKRGCCTRHKAWRLYRLKSLTCGVVVAGSQESALL